MASMSVHMEDGEGASGDPSVSLLHSHMEQGEVKPLEDSAREEQPSSPRSTSSSSIASITDEMEALYSVDFDSAGGVVAVGIITIEDVLEELLGDEIVDETDEFVDVAMRTRVNKTSLSRSLPPYLRKALKTGGMTSAVNSPVAGRTMVNGGSRLSIDGGEGAADAGLLTFGGGSRLRFDGSMDE
jgi:hypothetical protein